MRATEVKVWQVSREWSIDAMELIEQPDPMPRSGQVVVRMRAASLNYRDLLTVEGRGIAFGFETCIALKDNTDSEDDSRIMEGVGWGSSGSFFGSCRTRGRPTRGTI